VSKPTEVRRRELIVTRTVTTDECDWLDRDVIEGELVVAFFGCTYGCISPNGIAVSRTGPLDNPFFELPRDAIAPAGGTTSDQPTPAQEHI
jgi:hypothetical protein